MMQITNRPTNYRNPLQSCRLLILLFLLTGCNKPTSQTQNLPTEPFVYVLGIAQDAGYPQAGVRSEFRLIEEGKRQKQHTVSLLLVDPENNKRFLFEATPDFREQLDMADKVSEATNYPYDGIFLTHAHMGHYTGLMHMGFEAMGTKDVAVYAMPRMKEYLSNNGPWSQLVNFNNIQLESLNDSTDLSLGNGIKVMPFTVPHRDEYSETVGFKISMNQKSLVFIPDIDKWEKWDVDIREVVKTNDYILIDASFYADGELPGRDMSVIPHPFTSESMELFKELSLEDKAKVIFIHANHSNPILNHNSKEYKEVFENGFRVASEGQVITF